MFPALSRRCGSVSARPPITHPDPRAISMTSWAVSMRYRSTSVLAMMSSDPGQARDVQAGLEQARYVLLAGPSGSGKSTQMWRSAYDFSVGARVVRVRRLESESEVDELVRYVRLLNPEIGGACRRLLR